MNIQIGINPNCSEATMRILLDNENSSDVEALVTRLRIECENYYDECSESEWDGEEKKYELSSADINVDTMFGLNILTIHGDAPYNCADKLEKLVTSFLPKAKIEWSDG